jgi:hypothetical protein
MAAKSKYFHTDAIPAIESKLSSEVYPNGWTKKSEI